jgi:ribosomal protein S1
VNHVVDTPNQAQEAFAAMLNKSFETPLKPGTIAIGEILRVEKDGLLVDIGGKSEGFVGLREISNCQNSDDLKATFKSGDVREFFILSESDNDTVYYALSIRRVAAFKNWDKLAELKEANETVEATVVGSTKGGILVSVLDLKGFIPASQIRVAKTLNELVGETLPAKILEVDQKKNKLILSNRAAVFEAKAAQRNETLKKLNEGDIVHGHIVKVTDCGVFVDINGIDGLLPLSEISWQRINHPSQILSLGEHLTVQVLTVDGEQCLLR